jgi:hypothetical protein
MSETETVTAPSASAVSAFMGRRFTRAEKLGGSAGYSEGFTVREALGKNVRETDWVTVEYEPGAWKRARMSEADLLSKTQKILDVYARNLDVKYDVARNDEGGPDDWNCLLVRIKKGES